MADKESTTPSERVLRRTCNRCAASKRKCSGGTPCSRCAVAGVDCAYSFRQVCVMSPPIVVTPRSRCSLAFESVFRSETCARLGAFKLRETAPALFSRDGYIYPEWFCGSSPIQYCCATSNREEIQSFAPIHRTPPIVSPWVGGQSTTKTTWRCRSGPRCPCPRRPACQASPSPASCRASCKT